MNSRIAAIALKVYLEEKKLIGIKFTILLKKR